MAIQYRCLGLLGLCLLAVSVKAQQAPKVESGFSGDVLLGAVYLNSQSQLKADDHNHTLESFSDSAPSETRVLPGLLGNLYYTFDDLQNQIYLGVSRSKAIEGQFSPELGYRRLLEGRSSFTVAYVPSLIEGDTYQDPFVLGERRKETSQSLSAVRTKWSSIANTGIGVELAYGDLDIEAERSGDFLDLPESEKQLLERDATYGFANIEMTFPIAKGVFITPNLYGFNRDAKGEAYSFQATGAELAFFTVQGRHRITGNARYVDYEYRAINPVFNTKRSDQRLSGFLGYFYKAPFDWKDWTYTVIASYRDTDSNIDFYKTKGVTLATGFNWAF